MSNKKSGEEGSFSIYVKRVVEKLSLYASSPTSSDDFVNQSICKKQSSADRRNAFFEDVISIGALVLIDENGQIHRYGTEEENEIREGPLKGYYISSATVQLSVIQSISLTHGSSQKSVTFNSISAPRGVTEEEFEVDIKDINLLTYFQSLSSIWGENGEFATCDTTTS